MGDIAKRLREEAKRIIVDPRLEPMVPVLVGLHHAIDLVEQWEAAVEFEKHLRPDGTLRVPSINRLIELCDIISPPHKPQPATVVTAPPRPVVDVFAGSRLRVIQPEPVKRTCGGCRHRHPSGLCLPPDRSVAHDDPHKPIMPPDHDASWCDQWDPKP